MKAGIHPTYYRTRITCACGESFEVGSTVQDLRTEVCSKCHPFYTGGKQITVVRGGRVERFRKKYGNPEEN